MDSLIVPTTPEPHLLRPGNSTTELWEVILVASCPIIFIIFLCLCVVCLVVRSYERPSLPSVQTLRAAATSSSHIASILRQLPPPPKYDIAVTSVDAPPPLYSDIGKDLGPAGFRTTPSGGRPLGMHRQYPNHLMTPTVQPLNIQYLYPPRYEATISSDDTKVTPPPETTVILPRGRVEHVVVEIGGGAATSSA
ncbi:hypothetical protein CRE_26728 [Caenorhabditis remanei]|uniref:Uncharacterized protein n=1 Tax=Caenorhabditis remanei TaxID=31234 RepID=E3MXW5_CAERE|nr:hypothetical protein CRE_26728 [Caenorhabditis remanei]